MDKRICVNGIPSSPGEGVTVVAARLYRSA